MTAPLRSLCILPWSHLPSPIHGPPPGPSASEMCYVPVYMPETVSWKVLESFTPESEFCPGPEKPGSATWDWALGHRRNNIPPQLHSANFPEAISIRTSLEQTLPRDRLVRAIAPAPTAGPGTSLLVINTDGVGGQCQSAPLFFQSKYSLSVFQFVLFWGCVNAFSLLCILNQYMAAVPSSSNLHSQISWLVITLRPFLPSSVA